MVSSGNQLKKYKALKAKIVKDFKNSKVGYTDFTVDVCYGGNKEADLKRISLGGVMCRLELGQEFLNIILEAIDGNIDFWTDAVVSDINELNESLKQ